jgi:transposase
MRTQLKKLTMYNKVKELSREELSIRQISRNTGLDRATVRKYLRMTEEEFSDFLALQKQRNRKLQTYEEFIKQRVTDYPDCSAAQVEDWLIFNFRLHLRTPTHLMKVPWAQGSCVGSSIVTLSALSAKRKE